MKKLREKMFEALSNGDTFIEQYDIIEKKLSKYFSDKNFLKSFRSSGDAMLMVLQLLSIRKNEKANRVFNTFLKRLNSVPIETEYIQVLNSENKGIMEFQNFYWSQQPNNEGIDENDIYKTTQHLFSLINNTCEGIIKHYVNILFFIEKNNDRITPVKKRYSFGDKVECLSGLYPFLNIDKISLSQWRNIADHKSYIISNNKICCYYGDDKFFSKTVHGLIKVVNQILTLGNALYLAFTIFLYSHTTIFKIDSLDFRKEIWQDSLKVAFAGQNFLVRDIKINKICVVTVEDKTIHNAQNPARNRLIQCAQYVLNFWPYVKKSIRLVFLNNREEILGIILHKSRNIIYREKNDLEFSYLAEKMEFEYINRNI